MLFNQNFFEDLTGFHELVREAHERASMDEMSLKIIDLCNLEINHSAEFLSRMMRFLLVFLSVIVWFISGLFLVMILIWMYVFLSALSSPSLSASFSTNDYPFLHQILPPLIFWIPLLWWFLFNKWIASINIFKKLRYHALTLYSLSKENTKTPADIENILKQSQKIKHTISFIMNVWRLKFIFSSASKWQIKELISITTSLGYISLTQLRSDLQFQLREQQKTLEWAKLEIETYLVGSQEILKISELQKIRLDRQIEQFEKLQQRLI